MHSFKGTPPIIRMKSIPTQTRVCAEYFCQKLSLYDNFGLPFKGLVDMATEGIENFTHPTVN